MPGNRVNTLYFAFFGYFNDKYMYLQKHIILKVVFTIYCYYELVVNLGDKEVI